MPTLNWIGKDKVINHHQQVPYHLLKHKYGFSHEEGQTDEPTGSGNMIIHGDNLLALKSLLPMYEGRIKCIYIDPPYNTGNEGWVYNDNVNDPRISKWLGEVVGKEGEDFTRHDKWLCMMYPRLVLLKKLLADDGAIFISIDDNEQARLKLICDEIFGEKRFKTDIIWQKRYTRSNNTVDFTTVVEHILVYSKDEFVVNLLPRTATADKRYTNPDNDPRGPWKGKSFLNPAKPEQRVNLCYTIVNPNTLEEIENPKTNAWRVQKSTYERLKEEDRLYWGKDGKSKIPVIKMFLSEARGLTPINFWDHEYAGNTDNGTSDLQEVIAGKVFENPKPVKLIYRILEHCTNLDKDDIILDSFAGSGTTAHAVLCKNRDDGGNRKFILIEMGDYADSTTAERIKRVINGYGSDPKTMLGIGGAFDYYEMGETLYDAEGNLNEQASEDGIRNFVYYTEARQPLARPRDSREPYLMDIHDGTAYYFYYKPGETTVLNRDTLEIVKHRAEQYIIYADACELDEAFMRVNNIIFKKIPRDIKRF